MRWLNDISKFIVASVLYTLLSGESLTFLTFLASLGILTAAVVVHFFRSLALISEPELPYAEKVKYNLFISLFFAPVVLNLASWGFYLINALGISWFLYDIRYSALLLIPLIGLVKIARLYMERHPEAVFK